MQTTRREFKNERSLWNGEREPHNLTPLMESGFDGSIIFRVLPQRESTRRVSARGRPSAKQR